MAGYWQRVGFRVSKDALVEKIEGRRPDETPNIIPLWSLKTLMMNKWLDDLLISWP